MDTYNSTVALGNLATVGAVKFQLSGVTLVGVVRVLSFSFLSVKELPCVHLCLQSIKISFTFILIRWCVSDWPSTEGKTNLWLHVPIPVIQINLSANSFNKQHHWEEICIIGSSYYDSAQRQPCRWRVGSVNSVHIGRIKCQNSLGKPASFALIGVSREGHKLEQKSKQRTAWVLSPRYASTLSATATFPIKL